MCTLSEYHIGAEYGLPAYPYTLYHNTAGTYEAVVFNNSGSSLWWFQYATDAYAARIVAAYDEAAR